ncbi:unnamed protein product [Haemonchus placei]|uniref:Uncharacterized protein n=1 Tax=Haemonchus placei TaxID=6290 RepID=A0A3P7YK24_HAEPC|nr:unnamed protein product [Haemonchus placei]
MNCITLKKHKEVLYTSLWVITTLHFLLKIQMICLWEGIGES